MNVKSILKKILEIDDLVVKKHTHNNKDVLDVISQTSLNTWSDKYTKNETDNKLSQLVTSMDWKEAVNSYAEIATTYPNPDNGWTVSVRNGSTYRYNGTTWEDIGIDAIPLATSSVDGKMSKQDKVDHDDMNNKKHTHPNKSTLDTITQALIDAWNSAYSHISDTVRHITSDERTLWNTVSNKADSNHTHDDRYYTETETDNKFATKNEVTTAGYGNMFKSVYDTNNDGIVDNADMLDGKHASDFALSSHGNHVPTLESANNTRFLRNDDTWQTITPSNIGALSASSNAVSASKLATSRNINLAGDVTGSISFDGSSDITINTTLKVGLTWSDLKGV